MAVETSFRKDAILARCFLTYSGWGEGLKVWGEGGGQKGHTTSFSA